MSEESRSGTSRKSLASSWRNFWNRGKEGGITRKKQFQIAFPMLPVAISNGLIHSAYIKYYTDIVGLGIEFVGIIWFLFSIWNALNDPLIGVLIDRFKFRPSRGKYTYLLRVTAPVTLLASGAMLFAAPAWPEWVVFLFLTALLFVFDTTQTFYSISHANYILVVAPTSEERISTSVIQMYLGQAGAFLSMVLPTLLLVGDADRSLVVTLFSLVIVVNAIMYLVALRPLREDDAMFKDVKNQEAAFAEQLRGDAKSLVRSRPFLAYLLYQVIARGATVILFTQLLYMADHVLGFKGMQTTLADLLPGLIMFAFLPLFPKWSRKTGIRNLIMLASIPLALGYMSLMAVNGFLQALLAYSVIIVSTNVGSVLAPVIMGFIIDEDERRTGVRKAGIFTGMNALLTIPIGGLHTMIFTTMLSYCGYVSGGETQTEAVRQGIRLASSMLPGILILIGTLPLFFFPISKKVEEELSEYSARMHRGDVAAEAAVNP
jgi:GPH family glycoside/pentoside/hexuronide:cation symporter